MSNLPWGTKWPDILLSVSLDQKMCILVQMWCIIYLIVRSHSSVALWGNLFPELLAERFILMHRMSGCFYANLLSPLLIRRCVWLWWKTEFASEIISDLSCYVIINECGLLFLDSFCILKLPGLGFLSIYYYLISCGSVMILNLNSSRPISIQVEPSRLYIYTPQSLFSSFSVTWGLNDRWRADSLTRFWPHPSFLYSALAAMTTGMYCVPISCSVRLRLHGRLGEFHCHKSIKS